MNADAIGPATDMVDQRSVLVEPATLHVSFWDRPAASLERRVSLKGPLTKAERQASATEQLLETFHPCAGAVLILLSGATANPAGAYEHAAAKDRHGPLAEKHVIALGHDNAAQRGMVGARRLRWKAWLLKHRNCMQPERGLAVLGGSQTG